MRWKLLLITPFVAALLGAGASLGLLYSRGVEPASLIAAPRLLALAALALPVGVMTYATIFVYRHTARRRVLQATATALLSIILTLAALYLGSLYFFTRPTPAEPRTPIQNAG